LFVLLPALLGALCALGQVQPATVAAVEGGAVWPASAPASTADDTARLWREVRLAAVQDARMGRFASALNGLKGYSGGDQSPSDMIGALGGYLAERGDFEAERVSEYDKAVGRVRTSLLAEKHLPALVARGLVPQPVTDSPEDENEVVVDDEAAAGTETRPADDAPASTGPADNAPKDLRQAVTEVVDAYADVDDGQVMDLASTGEAAKQRDLAVEALRKVAPRVAAALVFLVGDDEEYAATFRSFAAAVVEKANAASEVWAKADMSTPDGVSDAAVAVRQADTDLGEALLDLEIMVSANPWRIGLSQASLAESLADDKSDVADTDWFTAIESLARDKATQAMADARWYDALRAWQGLSDLDRDNRDYDRQLKTAHRHVRMLALYGGNSKALGDDTTWRDLLENVDINMAKKVISDVSSYYVEDIDHRKLAMAGLDALEVLAGTPQVAKTFPGLASAEKKREFLDSLAAERQSLQAETYVDRTSMWVALHHAVDASYRTIQVPGTVIAVEFTEAMLDELDPFSTVVWPREAQDFIKQTSGKFYGVGIQITKEPGQPLQVVTPLADTPAFKEGIRSGDVIVGVDGQATEALSIDRLVRMITGEKGTKVLLTIRRPGTAATRDYAIIRDEIRIKTVKGWRRRPDGTWDYMVDPVHRIGYIRLTQFTEETVTDIHDALGKLKAEGCNSLVLDLRFNPGGLLQSAAAVADEFLKGGTIVSTRTRSRKVDEVAHSRGNYLTGDLVVLVNKSSASAAEIVSGALKDWARGTIVGERSFGKGSVQHVISIKDEIAFLKLTAAYYYLPSGRLLHRQKGSKDWGVDPDIDVPLTPRQITRWVELQRKTDLLQDVEPAVLSEDLDRQLKADLQLSTAVVLLRMLQLNEETKAAA
jgi:carboxyl-terminal processing protease